MASEYDGGTLRPLLLNAQQRAWIMFSKRDVVMETYRTGQAAIPEDVLEEIKQQLALIQFGSLEIQVHNGQVVQIERREKKRWEKSVNTK